jgi:hypothetical protein
MLNNKIKEDIKVIQKQIADIKTQMIDIGEDLDGNDGVRRYNPSLYRKKGIIKEIEEIKNDISLILKYLNVERQYIAENDILVEKPKQKNK